MSIKGSAGVWFRHALERGDYAGAVAEATELRHVELGDALSLLLLMADRDPELFRRAAARWVARFGLERRVDVDELAIVLTAVRALPSNPDPARDVLSGVCRRYDLTVAGLTANTGQARRGPGSGP